METKNNLFTLTLFLLMALASCQGSQSQMESTGASMDSPGMTATDTSENMNAGQGDGAALAALNAINNNEIELAAMAQSKKLSQPVMDYANMLHQEHSDNMDKTNQLASSMNLQMKNTSQVSSIREKGANTKSKLDGLDGKEFERAYIDDMVNGHTEALSIIDNDLLPKVTDDAVRQHLIDTRGHVAMHLDEAKKLKGNL